MSLFLSKGNENIDTNGFEGLRISNDIFEGLKDTESFG